MRKLTPRGLALVSCTLLLIAELLHGSAIGYPRLTVAPSSTQPAPPITLGLLSPVNLAHQLETAGRIAVEEVNRRGGVLGRSLVLVSLEDECGSPDAARQLARAVSQASIDILLGPFCPSTATAMSSSSSVRQKQVVVLTSWTTPDLLRESSMYSLPNLSLATAIAAARRASADQRATRFAIIAINPSPQGVSSAVASVLEQRGRLIVLRSEVSLFNLDKGIDELSSSGADALFLISRYTDSATRFLTELGKRGLDRNLRVKVGLFPLSEELQTQRSSSFQGMILASPFPPSALYLSFERRFRSRTGEVPVIEASLVYDLALAQVNLLRTFNSLTSYKRSPLAKEAVGGFGDNYIGTGRNAFTKNVYFVALRDNQLELEGRIFLPCPQWPDC